MPWISEWVRLWLWHLLAQYGPALSCGSKTVTYYFTYGCLKQNKPTNKQTEATDCSTQINFQIKPKHTCYSKGVRRSYTMFRDDHTLRNPRPCSCWACKILQLECSHSLQVNLLSNMSRLVPWRLRRTPRRLQGDLGCACACLFCILDGKVGSSCCVLGRYRCAASAPGTGLERAGAAAWRFILLHS